MHQGQVDVGALDDVVGAGDEEAGADLGAHRIAGDLFSDELVVGFVVVERGDDVVAEVVGAEAFAVGLESVALSEAHDVEPVARPAFAVAWAGERAVDEFLPSVGRLVGEEGIDFSGRRRQAVHDEVETADEGAAIGAR